MDPHGNQTSAEEDNAIYLLIYNSNGSTDKQW